MLELANTGTFQEEGAVPNNRGLPLEQWWEQSYSFGFVWLWLWLQQIIPFKSFFIEVLQYFIQSIHLRTLSSSVVSLYKVQNRLRI